MRRNARPKKLTRNLCVRLDYRSEIALRKLAADALLTESQLIRLLIARAVTA